MRRWLPLLVFTALTAALLAYSPSGASDANRVAVVVDFGNGQIASRCVSFSEETISGYEALERTGLPVETDFQTGGAAICRIDQQGCPADDCFCACRGGGDCLYWSYWHLVDGVWNYSPAGSGLYQVRDGMIEGWRWGLGSVTQASPPPAVSFGDVCATEPTSTPTQTATPSRTATPVILPTAVPTGDTLPTAAVTASPSAQPTVAVTGSAVMASITPSPTQLVSPTSTGVAGIGAPAPLFTTEPTSVVLLGSEAQSDAGDAANSIVPPSSAGPDAFAGAAATTAVATPEPAQPIAVAVVEPSIAAVVPATSADEVVMVNPGNEPSASMPVAPVAIIGAGSQTALPAVPASPEPDESAGWTVYAGFVGLVFLLAALALLVYWRRSHFQLVER